MLVSGGGSNFKAIHKAIQEGRINGEVVVVISDKSACGGVEYAKVRASHAFPCTVFPAPTCGAVCSSK